MSEVELAVLDRFEEVTKRQELMLEFRLQPGEMYFINNYTILHARTAFDDFEEEDRRRHLLRLWLEVPQMRPVHPHRSPARPWSSWIPPAPRGAGGASPLTPEARTGWATRRFGPGDAVLFEDLTGQGIFIS
jgi:hypothetical protein